jgi:hypothetical protein
MAALAHAPAIDLDHAAGGAVVEARGPRRSDGGGRRGEHRGDDGSRDD